MNKKKQTMSNGKQQHVSCNDCQNCFMHEETNGKRQYFCRATLSGLGSSAKMHKVCKMFIWN